MSLINQMLRDLDKRRRQGEVGSHDKIPEGAQPVGMSANKPRQFSLSSLMQFSLPTPWKWLLFLIVGIWLGTMLWHYWEKQQLSAEQNQTSQLTNQILSLAKRLQATQEVTSPTRKNNSTIDSATYDQLETLIEQANLAKATSKPAVAQTKPLQAMNTVQPALKTPVEAKSKIVLLRQLILTKDKNQTQLVIDVSMDPNYHIEKKPAKNEILVSFENTQLGEQFSVPDKVLFPVTQIHTKQLDNQLLLTLQLAKGTRMDDHAINNADHTQLTFNFIPPVAPTLTDSAQSRNANPDNQSQAHMDINKIHHTSATEMANAYYSKALKMAERHDIKGAISTLKLTLDKNPEFNNARETLAAIYIEQKHYVSATRLLDQGLSISPDYPPFINLKARILVARHSSSKALRLLESYSPSMKDYPSYYAFMAALYQKQGKFLISAKLYNELVKLQPSNGRWWLGMAIGLKAAGETSKALMAYKQARMASQLSPQLHAYIDQQITQME